MNKMVKINKEKLTYFLISIIIIILIVVLFPSKQSEESIKIGLIAPSTGPFAEWGQSIERGAELALEDTEHEFEIDYQDSSCEPEKTVTIARKLLDVENIKLILGPGCMTGLKAIASIAEEKEAVLFSTGFLDDEVFETYSNVLNLAAQISTEGKYTAKYLSDNNVKSVAIIHGTNAFGEEFGKRLPGFLEESNIRVTSNQASNLDETDFRTIILKAMEGKPEVLFIHHGQIQTGLFVKQLRELGYTLHVYSYYGTEAQSVLEAGGDALEGIIYTYPVNIKEESPEKKEFERRYREKYDGSIPSATSFFVYDGMMILDEAMDSCESSDTECVKIFFKEKGEYVGLSGYMRFEEDGSVTRPFGIKTVEDREFIWVTKEIEI